MPFLQALAIFAAGLAAGTINTVVGSGTLITFPTLLAFGYPPVLANVSNNVGLVPGVASGVHGYRAELAGTIALNASAGSTSSRIAPTRPPHADAEPSLRIRRRWPVSSAR